VAAVILDVDGTLIDSNDAHARAWVDAFAAHGITVPYELVRRAIGMGGDKLMPAVSGIEDDSDTGARISEYRKQYFKAAYLPRLRPFPGVRDLIQRMRQDSLTLVVASSAGEGELTPLLEQAGVADLLPDRTSSDDADRSKPDPDIVAAALEKAGVEPRDVVMIGDTPYDIEAAGRCGIRAIAVESGGWTARELDGAAEVYADPADLLRRYETSLLARMREDHATA
jgi:HAD superfamily hydrolase (TIGR01509 family)